MKKIYLSLVDCNINFCVIARSAFQRRSNLLRLEKIASPKKQARNDTKNGWNFHVTQSEYKEEYGEF